MKYAIAAILMATTAMPAAATPMFATPGANPDCFEQSSSGNFFFRNFSEGCKYQPVRTANKAVIVDEPEEPEEEPEEETEEEVAENDQ